MQDKDSPNERENKEEAAPESIEPRDGKTGDSLESLGNLEGTRQLTRAQVELLISRVESLPETLVSEIESSIKYALLGSEVLTNIKDLQKAIKDTKTSPDEEVSTEVVSTANRVLSSMHDLSELSAGSDRPVKREKNCLTRAELPTTPQPASDLVCRLPALSQKHETDDRPRYSALIDRPRRSGSRQAAGPRRTRRRQAAAPARHSYDWLLMFFAFGLPLLTALVAIAYLFKR